DVDELRGSARAPDVDDRGAPLLGPPLPGPVEQRLVQAERVDLADPFGVGLEQRFAVGEDGVVDGVPVTAELVCDLVHRPAEVADLLDDPPAGPVRQCHAWRGDAGVDDRPRSLRTERFWAVPAVLAPHQPGRASEARQVDQLHPGPVLDPSAHPAAATPRRTTTGFDVHDDRLVGSVIDGEDVHLGQADEQLAHARSVGLHRGSGTIDWCRNRRFLEPLCHARWTPSYALTPPRPRSDPKRHYERGTTAAGEATSGPHRSAGGRYPLSIHGRDVADSGGAYDGFEALRPFRDDAGQVMGGYVAAELDDVAEDNPALLTPVRTRRSFAVPPLSDYEP